MDLSTVRTDNEPSGPPPTASARWSWGRALPGGTRPPASPSLPCSRLPEVPLAAARSNARGLPAVPLASSPPLPTSVPTLPAGSSESFEETFTRSVRALTSRATAPPMFAVSTRPRPTSVRDHAEPVVIWRGSGRRATGSTPPGRRGTPGGPGGCPSQATVIRPDRTDRGSTTSERAGLSWDVCAPSIHVSSSRRRGAGAMVSPFGNTVVLHHGRCRMGSRGACPDPGHRWW